MLFFVFLYFVIFCGFFGTPYAEGIIWLIYAFSFCILKKYILIQIKNRNQGNLFMLLNIEY
jgi:hypothetical protein